MPSIHDLCKFLEQFAPPALAESWDNVGLLVGDRSRSVERVLTCLTVTPESLAEAVEERAELIVTHHPLPFQPVKTITTETHAGRLLWELIRHGIAVYSPHTAFDSTAGGINEQWAAGLELQQLAPLIPSAAPIAEQTNLGAGRYGVLPKPTALHVLAARVQSWLGGATVRCVGAADAPIERAAVACGSGGSFLSAAAKAHCQALITGEASFHTCLEAKAAGVNLILAGHYASERFAVERLAETLAAEFPRVKIWPSRRESDPIWLA